MKYSRVTSLNIPTNRIASASKRKEYSLDIDNTTERKNLKLSLSPPKFVPIDGPAQKTREPVILDPRYDSLNTSWPSGTSNARVNQRFYLWWYIYESCADRNSRKPLMTTADSLEKVVFILSVIWAPGLLRRLLSLCWQYCLLFVCFLYCLLYAAVIAWMLPCTDSQTRIFHFLYIASYSICPRKSTTWLLLSIIRTKTKNSPMNVFKDQHF